MGTYRNTVLRLFAFPVWLSLISLLAAGNSAAQTKNESSGEKAAVSAARIELPKIIKVDEIQFRKLLAPPKENARPLFVNFWATWCEPCREEFPDLVKIDEEFHGQIDFITISLDDLEEMDSVVPQFLKEMNAKMPAYLLFTNRESEVIGSIDSDWNGGLPFSVLYNEKRDVVYTKQGKIKIDVIRSQIEKLLVNTGTFPGEIGRSETTSSQ